MGQGHGEQDNNGDTGSRAVNRDSSSRVGTLGQVWGWGHLEQNGNEGIRNRVGTGTWSTGKGQDGDKGHQEQGGGLDRDQDTTSRMGTGQAHQEQRGNQGLWEQYRDRRREGLGNQKQDRDTGTASRMRSRTQGAGQ